MKELQAEMHARLLEREADSAKSASGTAFFKTHINHKINDWDETLKFIVEGQRWGWLQARVAPSQVEQWLEENNGQLPPGITVSQFMEVQFRKPTKATKAKKGE